MGMNRSRSAEHIYNRAQHEAPCRCAWEGCTKTGEYRAPKDRALIDYLMLCLEHVRAYNAQWNFHAGLSEEEMELEIRSASTWGRPTWKMSELGAKFRAGRVHVDDPFGFTAGAAFDARAKEKREEQQAQTAIPKAAPPTARNKALKLFEMTPPITMETLRRRYKALVKQHHPDANGGSADAESRMKVINGAYQTLRAGLAPQES
jgi:DnaJ-domain-containing protein 1